MDFDLEPGNLLGPSSGIFTDCYEYSDEDTSLVNCSRGSSWRSWLSNPIFQRFLVQSTTAILSTESVSFSVMTSDTDYSIGPANLPFLRRNNPFVQNLLISACLFCSPGLYLSIQGLGAGGARTSSTVMADVSNGALYGTFTFSALAGGTMINTFGPRCTTLIGITGYPIYIGGLWYFDNFGQIWYPVLGGAYLGISAGFLWSVAGFMALAYPEEREKGAWRAIQWTCSAGAIVGGIVALGISTMSTNAPGVQQVVYVIFIAIQSCSIFIAALMVPPRCLLRSDGSAVADFPFIPLRKSLGSLGSLFMDWRILLLLPACFAAEIFVVLQSSVNAYAYNLRTRSLNTILTNIVQITFANGVGYILDREKLGSRRRRGLLVVGFDAIWVTGTYIAQTIWLSSWRFDRKVLGPAIDWTDPAYPGAVIIYLAYGAQNGFFQGTILWLLGAMTNRPERLVHMGGLCTAVFSAGAAVAFGIDASFVSYEIENAAYFVITTFSWPIMLFIAANCMTDTNYFKEPGVGVPVHVQVEHETNCGSDSIEMA